MWEKIGLLGKLTCNIRNARGEAKTKEKKSSPNFGWFAKLGFFCQIKKVQQKNQEKLGNQESSPPILGKFGVRPKKKVLT